MYSDVVKAPDTGSTWISDAAIDTEALLSAVGDDITSEFDTWIDADAARSIPEWDGGDEAEPLFLAYLLARTGLLYRAGGRDNTYNHEQDLSAVFTYTAYVPKSASADWLYADGVYIAVCVQGGGDVRGNYGGPRLLSIDDPADSGFFDWVVSWYLEKDGTGIDDERVERGYSSHPTSELEKHYGSAGVWKDGAFVFQTADGEPTGLIATPQASVDA